MASLGSGPSVQLWCSHKDPAGGENIGYMCKKKHIVNIRRLQVSPVGKDTGYFKSHIKIEVKDL